MKIKSKIIISGLSVIILFSCNKDVETTPIYTTDEIQASEVPHGWGIHRRLVTDFPTPNSSFFCGPPAINCYDEIVISSISPEQDVYDLFSESFVNNDLGNFFENQNYQIIFPGLTSQVIDDLSNGTTKFIMQSSTNSSTTEMWVIVDSSVESDDLSESDVILAMPLNFLQ